MGADMTRSGALIRLGYRQTRLFPQLRNASAITRLGGSKTLHVGACGLERKTCLFLLGSESPIVDARHWLSTLKTRANLEEGGGEASGREEDFYMRHFRPVRWRPAGRGRGGVACSTRVSCAGSLFAPRRREVACSAAYCCRSAPPPRRWRALSLSARGLRRRLERVKDEENCQRRLSLCTRRLVFGP